MNLKHEHLNLLHHWYPNATTTCDAVDALLDLVQRKLCLQPNQIMSADSICCNDINSIEYPKRAYEMLGPFKMGGLNGFPFAGLTGMGAFAHHVPEDGALFVFYGPHIGLTKSGNIGEIFRGGQSTSSSCCGAATAALSKLLKDEIKDGEITELDYQQNTLEQILFRSKERVMSSAEPIVEATEVIYEAIDERMATLIDHTKFPCDHVIRMGAIMINGDFDVGSFSACRTLTCFHRGTGQVENWLPHNSGHCMNKSRMEAFSDGVIAILITIMVFEIKVPEGSDIAAFQSVVPSLLTFLLSFLYLGIYWNNHHHMLQMTERINGAVLWANLHLLFWLSLLPFVTGWLNRSHVSPLPVSLYGIVLLFAAIAYFILQSQLIQAGGEESKLKQAVGSDMKGKFSLLGYAAGIVLAWFIPTASVGVYTGVALMWVIPDKRIEQLLER